MKAGGWVPLSKYLTLPKHREYSEVEATYSLQRDYDEGNTVTVAGYSALWKWSRGKVERFLESLGVEIQYPNDTGRKQNQRGQIMIQITSRSRAENGQKRLIDSRCLADAASRSRAENGQKTSRSQSTTIDPNPDPKEKPLSSPSFEGKKHGKEIAEEVKKVARELARLILVNNPNNRELQPDKHEMTVERWAVDIDRMIRLDNREMREIVNVVRWCQADDFWKVNILSGEKLRKQYDKLVVKMKAAKPRMACIPDVAEHSFHAGITEDGRF